MPAITRKGRNPRLNPLPGDVLSKGNLRGLLERLVVGVVGDRIAFTAKGKSYTTPLSFWRNWAADAQVVKIAMNAS